MVAVMGRSVSSSDAIRSYIMTLRVDQKISQDSLADAIGMARRTYIAWETGEIKDIKVPLVVRAIKRLGGALEHLGVLDEADEVAGRDLALRWLRLAPDQRAQMGRIQAKLDRVIELGEGDPLKLVEVINRLRDDVQHDPIILDLVLSYLDGRRSAPR